MPKVMGEIETAEDMIATAISARHRNCLDLFMFFVF